MMLLKDDNDLLQTDLEAHCGVLSDCRSDCRWAIAFFPWTGWDCGDF